VQNPLTVLPTRLGLSVRAIDGPGLPAAAAGAPTPAGGYGELATGSAPFQSSGEAFQVSTRYTVYRNS
jgi:hypothetical protein